METQQGFPNELAFERLRKDTHGITLLAVNLPETDLANLQAIFGGVNWTVHQAGTCREALAMIRRARISVVICEQHLPDGDWRSLLDLLSTLVRAPELIVASRLADERLWAEVLNLGAFDLLVKPFDRKEVIWTTALAWNRWAREPRHHAQSRTASAELG